MAENRDYLGDQIGWAVRQITPPTRELKKIDRALMKALPRPLARAVARIRFNKGWLPETDHPDRLFNSLSVSLGQFYITKYGSARRINTLIMPGIDSLFSVHAESFGENQREISLRWDK